MERHLLGWLFLGFFDADFFGFRVEFFKAEYRFSREDFIVTQVTAADQLAERVGWEPSLSSLQKLDYFVSADEVVLVVIHHGDENVKLSQEVPDETVIGSSDVEVLSPDRIDLELIAEGFE